MSDDYDDVDGDGDYIEGAGTVLRPLSAELNRPAWAMPNARQPKETWDRTIRWGDERILTIPSSLVAPNTAISGDCLNVTFKRGQTCRIAYHAEVIEGSASDYLLKSTVELHVGCGSQLTVVRRSYLMLPQWPSAVIDTSWELPMTNIRGRVTATGFGPNTQKVRFALWLVPLVGAEGD